MVNVIIAVIIMAGLMAVCYLGERFSLWSFPDRLSEQERAAQALRQATAEMDDVFHEARVRMEEAVGKRQPGERISDWLPGSWREW
jgi:hypothetical protein